MNKQVNEAVSIIAGKVMRYNELFSSDVPFSVINTPGEEIIAVTSVNNRITNVEFNTSVAIVKTRGQIIDAVDSSLALMEAAIVDRIQTLFGSKTSDKAIELYMLLETAWGVHIPLTFTEMILVTPKGATALHIEPSRLGGIGAITVSTSAHGSSISGIIKAIERELVG